jgi:hypothetical protein
MQASKKKKRNNRDSLDTLYRKRDRALERVVAIWHTNDDSEDLNTALDGLTLAHTAVVFEVVGGR